MARYSIGRSRDNDIVLTDTTISRQHAEIEDLGGGRFVVRDVGSSRGTLVQQGGEWQDVTETEVSADQPIVLGEFETSVSGLMKEAGIALPSTADASASAAPASSSASGGASSPAASAASAPASGGGQAASGAGLSPGAKWALIGGGIFLVVAIVTAVVLVLVLGDGKGGGLANTGGGTSVGTGGSGGGGGSGGSGNALDSRFVSACTNSGNANKTQCSCMAGVARKQLSSKEFELFTLSLEARRDATKRTELRNRAQELITLSKKLRTLARAVQQQCGSR
jgi:hypothetical protein